jgi:uncharacterized protein
VAVARHPRIEHACLVFTLAFLAVGATLAGRNKGADARARRPAAVETLYLCAFAFLAGFVDSVVGGGGLIQLPALFLCLPPALAGSIAAVFGTNKMSSICGTCLAVVQYARRVPMRWHLILPAAGAAFVFSFLGARVVTLLKPELLRPLVFGLLVTVAAYTFSSRNLGDRHAPRFDAPRERLLGIGLGVGIGFYDGFFGPGTGSFLIFAFVSGFGFDFLTASANAKVINFATNLAAVGYFAATGHVLWRYALPMAACNMLGSLAGTHLAILRGNRFVRGLFRVVIVALILRLGWDLFRRSG